ncbi:helix-turn-helix transcriptional regulator [Algivirga pacifica]|uniref:HTH cro/C1-type domain-containing protein n=1 Tax=Algivirga pacifica TaxID=1162670 RepID=A0ABP9DCA9_9BACT
MHKTISDTIKDIRERLRIKPVEVANKLGMERGNYSRLEKRGDKLTWEQICNIADAMKIPPYQIIQETYNLQPTNNGEITSLENKIKHLESIIDALTRKDRSTLISLEKVGAEYICMLLLKNIQTMFLYLKPYGSTITKKDYCEGLANQVRHINLQLSSKDNVLVSQLVKLLEPCPEDRPLVQLLKEYLQVDNVNELMKYLLFKDNLQLDIVFKQVVELSKIQSNHEDGRTYAEITFLIKERTDEKISDKVIEKMFFPIGVDSETGEE